MIFSIKQHARLGFLLGTWILLAGLTPASETTYSVVNGYVRYDYNDLSWLIGPLLEQAYDAGLGGYKKYYQATIEFDVSSFATNVLAARLVMTVTTTGNNVDDYWYGLHAYTNSAEGELHSNDYNVAGGGINVGFICSNTTPSAGTRFTNDVTVALNDAISNHNHYIGFRLTTNPFPTNNYSLRFVDGTSGNGPFLLWDSLVPVINNDGGASNITTNAATLNGYLTSTGVAPAYASVYWGTNDGGMNAGSWINTNLLGQLTAGPFSTSITGLTSNTLYYYRCFASNALGRTWAPATTNFTTLAGDKQTPTLTTQPTASAITYGQALSASTLSGGSATNAAGGDVPGAFAFTAPAMTPNAGTADRSVTFTPTDTGSYNPVVCNVSVAVNKQAPTLTTQPTASAITYGQALSASTLSGGSATNAAGGDVPGAFAFTAPATIPAAGTASQSVTFTPTDAANYNMVVFNVSVTVIAVTPPPSAPAGVAASDGTYTNKVRITWNASSRATSYQVWRYTNNSSGSASNISSPDLTGTNYDDTSTLARTTFYYWVKAVNAAGASPFSASDSGFIGIVGPLITANGLVGDVYLNGSDTVSIAVQIMNVEPYAETEVDWWVIACAGPSWYYLNNSVQWTQFNGDLSNCDPVYQGGLFNLPATTIVNQTLPLGSYTFWFAVDYPMDGILDPNGQILFDKATVVVQ